MMPTAQDLISPTPRKLRRRTQWLIVAITALPLAIFGSVSCAHAATPHLPQIVVGDWCYFGGEVPGVKNAAIYAPCKEHVSGGGCEDITLRPDGFGSCGGEPLLECRVTRTKQTIYGLEVDYRCPKGTEHHLMNMLSPDRLMITWGLK
jgi:hypothetical protein